MPWIAGLVVAGMAASATTADGKVPAWAAGPPRAFVGARVDIGFAYLRPRLSVGHGTPHRKWAGMEANPTLSGRAAGGYIGLRLAHPHLELRSGMLESYSFRRSFLPQREHHDMRDVEFVKGPHALYVAWDSELELSLPTRGGALISESEVIRLFVVPDNRHVYFESLPVIAAPPWIVRQRLGYQLTVGRTEDMRVTPVVEVLWVPARDDMCVWRAGLTWSWRLFPDTELRAAVVPVVASPDRLGLAGGDVGEIDLRWTWATR